MPVESDLVNPVCFWFRDQFRKGHLLLIHEEVRGRGGRRPDILVVVSDLDNMSIDDVLMIPIEVEKSTKGAIHNRRHGLQQLRKYPGHMKYLAIPSTMSRREAAKEIPSRCLNSGVGLLVVDHDSLDVRCEVQPREQAPNRTLRAYPVAMRRWIALRNSCDSFRWISGRRIVERG